MSRDSRQRDRLTADLNDAFRQLSAATIMFHQAIADRLGMNITDHKCVDILSRSDVMTAGELAQYTGLTTGAITGVVDRLEKAGFVRRVRDPQDRRRVIVEPVVKRIEQVIGPLFESMGQAAAELCARYNTHELAVIHDFTVRAHGMAIDEARKLHAECAPAKGAKRNRATK